MIEQIAMQTYTSRVNGWMDALRMGKMANEENGLQSAEQTLYETTRTNYGGKTERMKSLK